MLEIISKYIFQELNYIICSPAHELLTFNAAFPLAIDKDTAATSLDKSSYLQNIYEKVLQFDEKHEVWDREELKANLVNVVSESGNFVCLVGGKSTGKSFLLNVLANRPGLIGERISGKKILLVDLRKYGGNLLEGVLSTLKADTEIQKFSDIIPNLSKISLTSAGLNLEAVLAESKVHTTKVLTELADACPNYTLIIDEANLAFASDNADESRKVLQCFTYLTKQTKKINVILTSSEHVFPFRLAKLGFKMGDLSAIIYAGEVPPNKMWELLTKRFGMGEHLAHLLIDRYGGHIYDVCNTIKDLKNGLDIEAFSLEGDGITSCLEIASQAGHEDRLLEILKGLAETGFVPLNRGDQDESLSRTLSEQNIAGVVTRKSMLIGCPKSVWPAGVKKALIPHKQSTRITIAEYLATV